MFASPLLPLPSAKVIRVRLVLLMAPAWLVAMRWTWYKLPGSRPWRTQPWEEAFRTVAESRGQWSAWAQMPRLPPKERVLTTPLPHLLGLWGAEDRLTEGLVLSIGPEDGVVGKGALPQLRGLGHPLQLGPGLANVP